LLTLANLACLLKKIKLVILGETSASYYNSKVVKQLENSVVFGMARKSI
jgi:hypothetical protein